MKRKFHLLEPFKHLLVAGNKSNGRAAHTATTQHSVQGGGQGGGRGDSVEGGGQRAGEERHERNTANGKSYFTFELTASHTHTGHRGLSHVELFDGGQRGGVGRRKLMAHEEGDVSDEEWEMAEWVARGKWKELTRDEDIQK